MSSETNKEELIYYNKFFCEDDYLENLKSTGDEENDRIFNFFNNLNKPYNTVYLKEIDKWLQIAFEHGVKEEYSKKLKNKKYDYIEFISALNELMAAYYFSKIENFEIRFFPEGEEDKKGDLEIKRNDNTPIFVEVKSPCEEPPKNKPFAYSSSIKVSRSVINAYNEQFPKGKQPTLLILVDKLKVPLQVHNVELRKDLYYNIYTSEEYNSLGAVGTLKFYNVTEEYIFDMYLNLQAQEKCKIHPEIFSYGKKYSLNSNSLIIESDEGKYYRNLTP